jgi:adenylate cyclase
MNKEGQWLEFVNECGVFVPQDQTILEACISAQVPLFHVCGGHAKCSTCRVLVMSGAEYLGPPSEKERQLQALLHFPAGVRLSCQTRLTGGPVRIQRIIRDESDIDLYVVQERGTLPLQMGKEVELVLFFLDIRSFTQFVQSHLSFDVIHIVRKLFAVFQKIIRAHEGQMIETTGDGFYAVFGCEKGKIQSVRDAVACANGIIAEMEQLNTHYFSVHFNQQLEVGIGVHVGNVISGDMPLNGKVHRIVMGLPVNVASRLQNATKEVNNNFLVSAELFALLPKTASVYPSSILRLQGVSEPITVFHLGTPY